MSVWSDMDKGTRGLILGAGALALAGIGYVGWQVARPVSAPVAPVAEALVAPETVAEAPVEKLPKIDTWRVAADGEAVVSGRAEAGAKVEVLVDSLVVARGEASASGEFALLFTLAPNPEPSLMWLSMTGPGGKAVASEEMVALGPIEGPAVAATDAPETAAATTEVAGADEATAPPALLLSDEGAVVLQDPAVPPDEKQVTVMIDTIAYTPEGEVQIGGRGKPGAALRIYLDNAEKVTLRVAGDGLWRTPLEGTAPGIYTLRVDQLDEAGKVASRFETPFKRETPEALAAVANPAEPAPVDLAEAALPEAEPPISGAVAEMAPVAPSEPPAGTEPDPAVAEAVEAEPAPAPEPALEPPPEPASEASPEPAPVPTPEPPQPPVAVAEAEPPTTPAPEPVAEAAIPAPPAADLTAETVAEAAPAPRPPVTVTVQPGFTLWGIAQERWGDGVYYVQVFEANKDKIKNPDLIYPGQVFAMPDPAAP